MNFKIKNNGGYERIPQIDPQICHVQYSENARLLAHVTQALTPVPLKQAFLPSTYRHLGLDNPLAVGPSGALWDGQQHSWPRPTKGQSHPPPPAPARQSKVSPDFARCPRGRGTTKLRTTALKGASKAYHLPFP